MNRDSKTVQSLLRGIEGLEMAIEQGSIKPSDLAEKLDINRSSAYRLLYTLVKAGYLQQETNSRRFVPNLVKLRSVFRSQNDWMSYTYECLGQICQETGEISGFAFLNNGVLVTGGQEHPPTSPLRVILPAGTRRPLHATAMGKAILAFCDEETRNNLLLHSELAKYTQNTIVDLSALYQQMEEVRENGYAVNHGEAFPNMNGLAVPVFNKLRRPIAALSISSPMDDIIFEKRSRLVAILKRYADSITQYT